MRKQRNLASAIAQAEQDAARLDATYARARLERERDQAKAEAKLLRADAERLRERVHLLERIAGHADMVAPPWARPTRTKHDHNRATPGLLLSDLHLDEVVNPSEVEGLNGYNREIALLRLKRTFARTVKLARDYLAGLTYDGFTLQLGGDNFSGLIHDELVETNEDTVFGSLLYWADHVGAFISGLADEFKHVQVACVSGNHGRLTRKPRAKFYARDNLDWLFYNVLRREFRRDARVEWNIPDASDAETVIYGTRIRLSHGDQPRGGSGISGKRVPLSLWEHRKTRRVVQSKRPTFDVLMYGHWHEYDPGERMLGNGSLKGVDEYALRGEFGSESPKQAFFVVTPQHGITIKAPVFACDGDKDRKEEQW